MKKMVFGAHAVKRVVERHLPIDAVWQIATVGTVVQTSGLRKVKQGEFDGRRIRVVVEQPNVIVTAYAERDMQATIKHAVR